MAEVPSAGDSQHQGAPPGNGVPGMGPGRPGDPDGPGGPEGPSALGGPGALEDDWDQEASLAAFVAEVEANRKFGLIDPGDYYDPDGGYDLPDDTAGPPGLLLDGRSRMPG